jgi:hypothetical protein
LATFLQWFDSVLGSFCMQRTARSVCGGTVLYGYRAWMWKTGGWRAGMPRKVVISNVLYRTSTYGGLNLGVR